MSRIKCLNRCRIDSRKDAWELHYGTLEVGELVATYGDPQGALSMVDTRGQVESYQVTLWDLGTTLEHDDLVRTFQVDQYPSAGKTRAAAIKWATQQVKGG